MGGLEADLVKPMPRLTFWRLDRVLAGCDDRFTIRRFRDITAPGRVSCLQTVFRNDRGGFHDTVWLCTRLDR